MLYMAKFFVQSIKLNWNVQIGGSGTTWKGYMEII